MARTSLPTPCVLSCSALTGVIARLRTAGVGREPHVWTLRCESMDLPWWLRTTLFCTYYIHLVRRMLSMTGGVCCDAHKQQYTLRTGCASALTGMGLVNVCVHVSRGFRFRQGPGNTAPVLTAESSSGARLRVSLCDQFYRFAAAVGLPMPAGGTAVDRAIRYPWHCGPTWWELVSRGVSGLAAG